VPCHVTAERPGPMTTAASTPTGLRSRSGQKRCLTALSPGTWNSSRERGGPARLTDLLKFRHDCGSAASKVLNCLCGSRWVAFAVPTAFRPDGCIDQANPVLSLHFHEIPKAEFELEIGDTNTTMSQSKWRPEVIGVQHPGSFPLNGSGRRQICPASATRSKKHRAYLAAVLAPAISVRTRPATSATATATDCESGAPVSNEAPSMA
jgi:hypothetical protein